MAFNGGSTNGVFSEKLHKFLTFEYATVFSGLTDAPKVSCDLTDRHTYVHTDPNTVTLLRMHAED